MVEECRNGAGEAGWAVEPGEVAGTWLDEPFSISMWQSRELAEVPAA